MDVFSRSKPNLVNNKVLKHMNKIFKTTGGTEPTWGDNLSHFYVNYIQPNLFPLIILVIISVFLTIRYFLKQNKTKHKKKSKHRERNGNKYKIKYENINMYDHFAPYLENIDSTINEDIEADHEADQEEVDKNSIFYLGQEYQKSLEENKGIMSEQMIRELYETKSSKMSFDELARVICGGSSGSKSI